MNLLQNSLDLYFTGLIILNPWAAFDTDDNLFILKQSPHGHRWFTPFFSGYFLPEFSAFSFSSAQLYSIDFG